MKPFAFRQRVGKLNWKLISSVDLELIIDENQIEELQSVIDDVIFSEITNQDIKEYLLYCQESQLQLVRELHKKNKVLKNQNKELNEQNESIKEDVRIYKRQINSLKSSIEKYKQMVLKNDGYVAVAPRIFNPLSPDEQKDTEKPNPTTQLSVLVESMLRHERQTRDFVKEVLDEQRVSLLREFDRMSSRSENDRMNSLAFEQNLNTYVDRIAQKIERVALSAASTALQSVPTHSPVNSELELRLQEVSTRERRVAEKERDIQDKLYDFDMKMKTFERQMAAQKSENQSSMSVPQVRSVGINTAPIDLPHLPYEEIYRKGIILASHFLARKISSAESRSQARLFQRWKSKVFHYTLKLNKSYLLQQDASTNEIIELRKVIDKSSMEHRLEINKLRDVNAQLEKKLAALKSSGERITIPSPTPIQVEAKKRLYEGPNEVQMMADALLRIQQSVTDIQENEEDIMDDLAGELLERVNIRDDDSNVILE